MVNFTRLKTQAIPVAFYSFFTKNTGNFCCKLELFFLKTKMLAIPVASYIFFAKTHWQLLLLIIVSLLEYWQFLLQVIFSLLKYWQFLLQTIVSAVLFLLVLLPWLSLNAIFCSRFHSLKWHPSFELIIHLHTNSLVPSKHVMSWH